VVSKDWQIEPRGGSGSTWQRCHDQPIRRTMAAGEGREGGGGNKWVKQTDEIDGRESMGSCLHALED
jgi:hypothetical protein